ncbi:MAG: 2-amino-4-hydroxy-6-hydroxymethyldihydropteridine diphosphokinase [Gammaproteobacteria bacterium]|nr:2-amino-4-hydroxy-6-hydroxymethyldihydropteridine diphosphokinase [Gammaproteobacteria bacterium]MDH5303861.1 2-amino-4-hydroxy-6-hydroxymethyldihydropteridine diphosphokinase [Gammaproteobacteria bacterium]MDH5321464.1 2-amino-4-hydroxy-6-hydroxymethyldihydropteridine diphosphokinase [Gammaproteobacteria bacterium]
MSRGLRNPVQACIGLGSNLNDPQQQVMTAIERLDALPGCKVLRRSSLYRSAPFGPVKQDDFINAVVVLETTVPADSLLARLKEMERIQGRVLRAERWGPRVLDLDILLYGSETIDLPGLTIPHPGIASRNFVLLPLREIAPELVIPGLGALAELAVNEQLPAIQRISDAYP